MKHNSIKNAPAMRGSKDRLHHILYTEKNKPLIHSFARRYHLSLAAFIVYYEGVKYFNYRTK